MIESYTSLILALLFTTAGQLLYRYYFLKKSKIYFGLTILSFVLVPLFSFFALKELDLDVVYIFTSVTIIMVLLESRVFLKEKLSSYQVCGSILIILGVVIYNL